MIKIITHPGVSHFDEFLAICLILANGFDDTEYVIERREPRYSDLQDPNTWVLDIGLKLEPEKHNFDHHQDGDSECAFVLVADYLGLTPLLQNIPWWKAKSALDTKGPDHVIKMMDLSIDEFLALGSPLERFMLDQFANNPNSMIDLMKSFGKKVISNAKRYNERMKYYEEKCYFVDLEVGEKWKVFINPTSDIFAINRYVEKHPESANIVAMLSHDDRGGGYMLYRFANEMLDFSILEDDPKVKFAHKNGFVLKTHCRISMEDILELIKKAIKPL